MSYHNESRDRDGYLQWLEKWVFGVKDRAEYLKLIGQGKMKSLLVKKHRKSTPVDYGF